MGFHPRNGLSLCAGAGGLDMGLMLAEPGFHTRCYVEWEEYPRQALIAAMRAGYFEPAPIWDNVKTFDARPLAGTIDTLLAGYPCQPFSLAGQRKGEDDERHLWPDIERIIRELGPHLQFVFLENVAGHLTSGLETVLRDLRRLDFTPAVGIFSAEEVGAPHERQRVFILAYRADTRSSHRESREKPNEFFPVSGSVRGEAMADTDGRDTRTERQQRGGKQRFQQEGGKNGRSDVDDASDDNDSRGLGSRNDRSQAGRSEGRDEAKGHSSHGKRLRHQSSSAVNDVDHATSARRNGAGIGPETDSESGQCLPGEGCSELGNAQSIGRREGWAEPEFRGGRDTTASAGSELADSIEPGLERHRRHVDNGGEPGWVDKDAAGSVAQSGLQLFPPGPSDRDGWSASISVAPHCAPSVSRSDAKAAALNLAAILDPDTPYTVESIAGELPSNDFIRTLGIQAAEMVDSEAAFASFCGLVNGLAQRPRALRLLGNGVLPLEAAYAWRTLIAAHGLGCVDLGTAE